MPGAAGVGMRWKFWTGLRVPRSKIDPRSTKNASSLWPANTVEPSLKVLMAAFARSVYFGVERGPTLTGGVGRLRTRIVDTPVRRGPAAFGSAGHTVEVLEGP